MKAEQFTCHIEHCSSDRGIGSALRWFVAEQRALEAADRDTQPTMGDVFLAALNAGMKRAAKPRMAVRSPICSAPKLEPVRWLGCETYDTALPGWQRLGHDAICCGDQSSSSFAAIMSRSTGLEARI
ncbi:hypothetical protein ACFWBG_34430 [Nocardia salmonicida]|uniref:hypothetical protein n=1 Tax=Nocardia salmonicida TaxID=53431 RepID=UPI00366BA7FE